VNIVEQYLLLLQRGQAVATGHLVERWGFAPRPLLRFVGQVPPLVPVDEVLEGPQQEGTGTAGRVNNFEGGGFGGGLALQQFAHRVFHDVIHDVLGRVIHPARLAHLGLFFHLRLVSRGQTDDLPQKLLVYLPEYLHGDLFEDVRAGIIQPMNDLLERTVIDGE